MNLHGRDPAAMIWRRLRYLACEGSYEGTSDRLPEVEPAGAGHYEPTDAFNDPRPDTTETSGAYQLYPTENESPFLCTAFAPIRNPR